MPSTLVAEWAGQSIEVLLRIYARGKCLDGEKATMRRRVEDTLGLNRDSTGEPGKLRRATAVNLAAYLPRTGRGGPVTAGHSKTAGPVWAGQRPESAGEILCPRQDTQSIRDNI